jgi:hypothetical protein
VTWYHIPKEWMPHVKEFLSKVTTNKLQTNKQTNKQTQTNYKQTNKQTNKQTAKDEFTQMQLLLYLKTSNSLKSVK